MIIKAPDGPVFKTHSQSFMMHGILIKKDFPLYIFINRYISIDVFDASFLVARWKRRKVLCHRFVLEASPATVRRGIPWLSYEQGSPVGIPERVPGSNVEVLVAPQKPGLSSLL